MSFLKRLFYYLGGFTLGIILLLFFLSGKKTSCDYGPNDRTLKHLRSKTVVYQKGSAALDTLLITEFLTNGSVIFSKSHIGRDSVNTYFIELNHEDYGLINASFTNFRDSLKLDELYLPPVY